MPTYVYSDADEEIVVEKMFRAGEAPRSIEENGRLLCRDYRRERIGVPPSAYRVESEAMGVDTDQIPEAMAWDKKNGCSVDYNPETGNPIFTSRDQRRKYMRAHNFYDRDGGYGDQSPS